jgi:hypothetical protein
MPSPDCPLTTFSNLRYRSFRDELSLGREYPVNPQAGHEGFRGEFGETSPTGRDVVRLRTLHLDDP